MGFLHSDSFALCVFLFFLHSFFSLLVAFIAATVYYYYCVHHHGIGMQVRVGVHLLFFLSSSWFVLRRKLPTERAKRKGQGKARKREKGVQEDKIFVVQPVNATG